jgi:hypothetical protein
VTVTVKVQLSLRCSASVAVHATVVEPIGKRAPLTAEQATATGVEPLMVVAEPKVTDVGCPFDDATLMEAGHEIFGESGTTGG